MIYLDNEDLDSVISNGNFIVDFYAEWCGPCKMLTPVLESISDKINIVKVDIDKFPKLTTNYRIMSVPTLIFFKDGKKFKEVVGFQTEEELLEIINMM